MQVTETLSDGLKREYQVTVPAADLEARMAGRLGELKDRVQLRGFRPGKVPVTHLRKVYGRSVMAETIEAVIRELNAKIVEDHGLKLAMEPKVTIPNEETEVERVIGGKSDLAYTLSLEVLPKIELGNFQSIKLERLTAEVTDAEIDEALGKIAEQNKPYAAKGEGAKVENGDRVVIDFTGKLDGAPFEGGTGGDVGVNVGSGTFIPGFEEQLIGMAVGETRPVNVTFPAAYPNAALAGKAAEFQVTAKAIETAGAVTMDDAFAKSLGMESLDKVKGLVKESIAREHGTMSRQKLKRQLLDQLDQMHKFAPPRRWWEDEFNNVWSAIGVRSQAAEQDLCGRRHDRREGESGIPAISERRVRLGLVPGGIGDKTDVSPTAANRARSSRRPGGSPAVSRRSGTNIERPRKPLQRAGADLRGEGRRLPGRACQGR